MSSWTRKAKDMLKDLKRQMTQKQLQELATDGLKTRAQLPSSSQLRKLAYKVAAKLDGPWACRLKRGWGIVYMWVEKHLSGRGVFSDMADAFLYPILNKLRTVEQRITKMLKALWEQVVAGRFSLEEYKKLEASYV